MGGTVFNKQDEGLDLGYIVYNLFHRWSTMEAGHDAVGRQTNFGAKRSSCDTRLRSGNSTIGCIKV
jgi:hypothetical protein